MRIIFVILAVVSVCVATVFWVTMPTAVVHTATQRPEKLAVMEATEVAGAECKVSMSIEEGMRILTSNGVPRHKVGVFPNAENPHALEEQNHVVNLPTTPKKAEFPTHVRVIGYTVEGVPFKPAADEYFMGNRTSGWRYEVLAGAVALGVDLNHAHVQEDGAYHYHGPPTLLMEEMGITPEKHSPQIGWAADGFPIYAYYGFEDPQDATSPVIKLASSYQLKAGNRPSGPSQPGGVYDGTFTADWKFMKGIGELDSCNGRFAVTPEFPDGTYAYYLSDSFPVVPRCLWGQVN